LLPLFFLPHKKLKKIEKKRKSKKIYESIHMKKTLKNAQVGGEGLKRQVKSWGTKM
jgi:hypothetical protein